MTLLSLTRFLAVAAFSLLPSSRGAVSPPDHEQHFFLRSSSSRRPVRRSIIQAVPPEGTNAGTIVVNVTRIRSQQGKICWALYDDQRGDFGNDETVLSVDCVAMIVVDGTPAPQQEQQQYVANFTTPELPFGLYAVAIFHDKNDNAKLDTMNFLGWKIPQEDFGFSNNPSIGRSGPDFGDSLVELRQSVLAIDIWLNRPPI